MIIQGRRLIKRWLFFKEIPHSGADQNMFCIYWFSIKLQNIIINQINFNTFERKWGLIMGCIFVYRKWANDFFFLGGGGSVWGWGGLIGSCLWYFFINIFFFFSKPS